MGYWEFVIIQVVTTKPQCNIMRTAYWAVCHIIFSKGVKLIIHPWSQSLSIIVILADIYFLCDDNFQMMDTKS